MSPRVKLLLGLLGAVLVGLLWSELKPQADRAAGASALDRQIDGGAARRASAGRPGAGATGRGPGDQHLGAALGRPRAGERRVPRRPQPVLVRGAPASAPARRRRLPPTPEEIAARQAAEEAARQAAMVAAAEAAMPKPPPITFTYLGSFGPPERRIAVLSCRRDHLQRHGRATSSKASSGWRRSDSSRWTSASSIFPSVPPEQLAVGEEGS